MAIIGESFEPWVKDQVNIRQQKLALKDRDNDVLKYITNKTSFLRLTSGVNIVQNAAGLEKLVDIGLGDNTNIGNILAKQYVLYSTNFNDKFTSNVGYSFNTTSYGFSSDVNYGLVPPPGIISADVKSLNRGSLREATINIICHNLYQFKIINLLFLKLRYSLLLEWGHTIHFNNSGNLESPLDIPNLSPDFINGVFKWKEEGNDTFITGNDQESLLKSIDYHRKQSNGNYDAFFGVIKNFNWELLENGSYNITINAISTGDVIESIKINANTFPNETSKTNSNDPQEVIYQQSTLHRILGSIKNKLDTDYNINIINNLSIDKIKEISGINYTYKRPNEPLALFETYKISNFQKLDEGSVIQYYIKLGTLLKIIESFILYGDTSKTNPPPVFNIDYNFNTNECFTLPEQLAINPLVCLIPVPTDTFSIFNLASPYVQIDTTITWEVVDDFSWSKTSETETSTYADIDPQNVPTSPIVVSVTKIQGAGSNERSIPVSIDQVKGYEEVDRYEPIENPIANKFTKYVVLVREIILNPSSAQAATAGITDESSQYGGFGFRSEDKFIGKLMNIHININYIISTIDNNIDKEGNLFIYDFLQELMSGVQQSLGYINNFEIIQNPDNNTYFIIDNTLIPIKYTNLKKDIITKFNINLLKKDQPKDDGSVILGNGSFITNFALKSELFAKIANTIAIGAQANSNTLMSNSTTFSEFNAGLIDRILIDKQVNNGVSSDQDINQQYTSAADKYNEFINLYTLENSPLTKEDVSSFESYITDIYNFTIGKYTKNKNIPGTGFIPLNLQLTMDGLSGMKIYQTFDIDETLLPSEYQNRIRFIIRGINHKIDSKGWETNIETLSIPKENNINNTINTNVTQTKKSTTDVKKAEQLLNETGNCKRTSYSDKPVVPYKQTTISDEEVMRILKKNFSREVALATFTVMKNEQPGPNGVGFKAFNNNYGGIQTDSGRWDNDSSITGRLCLRDRSGEYREFASFDSAEFFIKFKGEKIQKKGLYIGGTPSKFQDNPYYKKTLSNTTGVATSYGYEWIRSKAGLADGRWQRNPFVSLINSKYQLAENIYNKV